MRTLHPEMLGYINPEGFQATPPPTNDLCEQVCGEFHALHVLGLISIRRLAHQVPHKCYSHRLPYKLPPSWILQIQIEIENWKSRSRLATQDYKSRFW